MRTLSRPDFSVDEFSYRIKEYCTMLRTQWNEILAFVIIYLQVFRVEVQNG